MSKVDSADSEILMPLGTAVWLIQFTALTFKQIGDFCSIDLIDVEHIADGILYKSLPPFDPVVAGILVGEEIQRCESNPKASLQKAKSKISPKADKVKIKKYKYTTISHRKNKPDAALWCIKHHQYMNDAMIAKLIGMTKRTVESVRARTHGDYENLTPKDPVLVDLCTQKELDEAIQKSVEDLEKLMKDQSNKNNSTEESNIKSEEKSPDQQEDVDSFTTEETNGINEEK